MSRSSVLETIGTLARSRARIVALATAVVLSMAVIACGGDDDGGSGDSAKDSGGGDAPFKLGLAIAKSGTASSFDGPPVQGLELRVDQLNEAGGIDGRKIELITADTQSDPARATTAANQLLERGAEALAVTCDFDFGSPSAIAAAAASVPAISLCASDPKFADTKTIGPFAFTMGTGTDAKASIAAEYAYEDRGWRTAYLLQDTSIEYTKSLGKYFEARWTELGGKIVGKDSFNGLESAEVPTQVTKLRNLSEQPDLIYLPAFIPPAATVIKQIRDAGIETPIMSAASLDNPLLPKVVNKSSDMYSAVAYGCSSPTAAQEARQRARQVRRQLGGEDSTRPRSPLMPPHRLRFRETCSSEEALKDEAGRELGEELIKALETVRPGTDLIESITFDATCRKPNQPDDLDPRADEREVRPDAREAGVGGSRTLAAGTPAQTAA